MKTVVTLWLLGALFNTASALGGETSETLDLVYLN